MKEKIIGIIIVVAGALAVACVPTSKSDAQCRGQRVVAAPYVAPYVAHEHVVEVVTPIAVPVLVPAFQFQYQPPCACAPVVNQPGFIPGYGQANLAPGYQQPALAHGGQANVGYQQPGLAQPIPAQPPAPPVATINQQDKIKELAKALLEEMQRQSAGEGTGDPNDTGPPTAIDPTAPAGPAPKSPAAPQPDNTQPQPDKAALLQFSTSALQRNCAACHTGNGAKGEVVIFTQPGVLNPEAPWRTMAKEIKAGKMPPRSSQYKPTQQEAQVMLTWLGSM